MRSRHLILLSFLWLIALNQIASQSVTNEEGRGAYKTRTLFNLEKYWDSDIVCSNPHKGWEFHYFDNGIERYHDRLQPGDFLEDFPGLRTIYLRLGWSYLEHEEGKFNWELIDTVIQKWTARGYDISIGIFDPCKGKEIPVRLALKETRRNEAGYYKMGEIIIK